MLTPATQRGPQVQRGLAWAVSGAFWAAAYLIPYKAAAAESSPEMVVLPMLLWAAVLNGATVIAGARRLLPRLDRLTWLVAAALGAFTIIGNHAVAEALASTEPGIVSVLLRTQVLFVAFLGWWLLRESVTLRFLLGAVLAITGCVVMNGLGGLRAGAVLSGLLWSALAALCFAVMQVLTRRVIHRIQPVLVNGLRLWLAVLLLCCWPGRAEGLLELNSRVWWLTGAAALVGPFCSRLCLMWALRHITAAQCTLVALVGPVFAFALGFLFFATWPNEQELLGSLVVLAGVGLSVKGLGRNRCSADQSR